MNNKQQNLEDIRFIYEKVTWYLNQKPEDLILHFQNHDMDIFNDIKNQQGKIFICGHKSIEKFYNIAKRKLASEPDKNNKTNLNEFVEKLKTEFLTKFIENTEDITQQNIDRMISAAYKSTSREFEQLTHYIPCTIFFSTSIESFAIGSIEFFHKRKFELLYGDEINKLRAEIKEEHRKICESAISNGFPADNIATEEQSQHLADELVDGLKSWFGNYDSVAVVTIPKCNKKVSYDKAVWAIRTALNILKLLFGSYYTDEIRTGNDGGVFLESARLTRKENGKFDISLLGASNGNVAGDKWLDCLKSDNWAYYFILASNTLDLSLSFDNSYPLCSRFIDALSWYGDAVSEQSYAAKIVKYVTAIERLVGTGEEKGRGVTEIVTTRASIIYSIATEESFDISKEKVSKIYTCRSDLVHGSKSPFDDSCIDFAYKAEEISRMVLLIGLDYFSLWGIDSMDITQRNLREKYNELENSFFRG